MLRKMLLAGTAALPVIAGAAGTPAAKSAIEGLDIGTFSANIGIFSDYVFRGISQTNESAALQGGFDWEHDLGIVGDKAGLGLYAGVWGSNVDFVGITSESLEIDVYGGITGEVPGFSRAALIEAVTFDLGAIYYWYPGASNGLQLDYYELTGGLGFDFGHFSLGGAIFYSPNFTGDTGEALYSEANIEVPLPMGLTAGGFIGYQTIKDNDGFGLPDYTVWGASIDFDIGTLHSKMSGVTLGFQFVGSDIPEAACGTQLCDERYTVSLSADIGG